MAYTVSNFRTKKELKEAVATREEVRVFQPNDVTGRGVPDGTAYLEGPHYPQPHRWYAQCEVKGAVIVKGSVR